MIVTCPNCFLEQPQDQYCAGCGKQLDKLLEEESKKISKSTKQTNYLIIALTLCFLSISFYLFSSAQFSKKQAQDYNFNDTVKVDLPKAKIVGDKIGVNEKIKKEKKSIAIIKPRITNIRKVVAKKVDNSSSGTKKIKTFYFISTTNCERPFETNELNEAELQELMSCAKVHFKTSRVNFNDVIEDAPSFTTQFKLKVTEFLIELDFTLSTDLYVEEFKQTLPLEIEGESAATLWKNVGHDIESLEPPDKDMLSNYATSALFKFSTNGEEPPKLYFLAQYK